MIRSPFNFVPLGERAFLPDWAADVSHDVPFSDGVSGRIDLTITALSPIFVRNGAERNEGKVADFSHVVDEGGGRRFFIPATSIKGEVRNLMEILSFAKMEVDRRARFARRDLTPNTDYPLKGEQKDISCGWLRCEGDGCVIEDCGTPMRISHVAIDEYVGRPVMRGHFSKRSRFDIEKIQEDGMDPKTAAFKYRLVDGVKLDGLTFSFVKKRRDGQSLVEVDEGGDVEGTIVLTGQPSQWEEPGSGKKNHGKFYEFVFRDCANSRKLSVPSEDMGTFRFLYRDTPEWPRLERLLNSERGVPVFFRVEGGQIKDFGITFLYKLPYERSVHGALPDDHRNDKSKDLPQCIFGTAAGDGDDSLRGRVQFGNAFAVKAQEGEDVSLALGSPKASYLPMYVRQDVGSQSKVSKYKTYDNGQPSGWKRYHVRQKPWAAKTGDPKLDTTFRPLLPGATFEGAVYFHNLRPAELGALLSALTFHGSPHAYHQLGLAKPYGYGRCKYGVRLRAHPLAGGEARDADFYMGCFEALMDEHLEPVQWCKTESVRALMAMSTTLCPDDERFQYMVLDCATGKNEFKEAKERGEWLHPILDVLVCEGKPPASLASCECRDAVRRESELRVILKKVAEAEDVQSLEALEREFSGRFSLVPNAEELFAKRRDEIAKRRDERRQTFFDNFAKKISAASDRAAVEAIRSDFEAEPQGYEDEVRKLLDACEARLTELNREVISGGIGKFIPKITSHKQGVNQVRKWLERVGHQRLDDSEAEHVILHAQLQAAYAKAKGKRPSESQFNDWAAFMTEAQMEDLKDSFNIQ